MGNGSLAYRRASCRIRGMTMLKDILAVSLELTVAAIVVAMVWIFAVAMGA
jgi:hypothetical protein